MAGIQNLPVEIADQILGYLDNESLTRIGRCSSGFTPLSIKELYRRVFKASEGTQAVPYKLYEQSKYWKSKYIIGLLKSIKIDEFLVEEDGLTPFHHFAREGSIPVVRCLLERKLDPNFQSSCEGCYPIGRSTPLQHAMYSITLFGAQHGTTKDWQRFMELFEIFVKAGADINLQSDDGSCLMSHLIEYGPRMMVMKALGIVSELPVDYNILDNWNLSMVWKSVQRGFQDVLEVLLSRGAHPTLGSLISGETALHLAAVSGNLDMCEMLVAALQSRECSISQKNRRGLNAAEVAHERGCHKVAEFFVDQGLKIDPLVCPNRSAPFRYPGPQVLYGGVCQCKREYFQKYWR
ncbi:uncharacterized protein GIQ15_00733 [Arthroderma uncinatum]|uniref:uncharacterized protein n=1 Tax=Arthroderma uncinatum TaxID=74035 RepID=UPI00144A6A87|nr:uncharacterized protein GIQ15_00733 [Arthroderma uncinatum]KAF3491216.1 hypothetical protein GIQ15_00733 [Arthroderma uncinatum]